MDFTFVTTISRPFTITEMEGILHQTKLYLVELEDKPSTPEVLQHHQQLLDYVSRSLRSVKQNHQNLTSEIADLKSKLENEIAQTMQLTDDVKDLKETVLQQNTIIAEQNIKIAELTTRVDTATNKQNTLILRQIATSFQHKAAKYCGVGTLGRQYCITYNDLIAAKKGDAIKKNEVTALIYDKGFDETDISSFLQDLRIIGTSDAHPATSYDGRTPNFDELVVIIRELPEAGEITSNVKNDALKILELVQVLSTLIGSTDLLESSS